MSSRNSTRKVLVVTGAAGGIGLACAKLFKQRGYDIVGADKQPLLDPSNAEIFLRYHLLDLAKREEIYEFISELRKSIDRVDCLINSAAEPTLKSIEETTDEEFDRVMTANLKAPIVLIRELLSLMTGADCSIVNISSVQASRYSPTRAVYAASKMGLLSATQALVCSSFL